MIQKVRLYLFIVVVLFSVGCQAKLPIETNLSEEVGDFSFTNEQGEEISRDDLKGNWWIADFIFTNCTSVCPVLTQEMAKIQSELEKADLDVILVSFTVDPENDTPERLKEFVASFTDNDANWYLLTGYTQAEIEQFANQQFQTIVQKPADSDQVIHGSSIYLIDQHGNIIKKYHYSEEDYIKQLLEDIEKLL